LILDFYLVLWSFLFFNLLLSGWRDQVGCAASRRTPSS
jgi:hypothetical protein